ncbi:hypothetical protein AKJ40_04195 [candidate division MSBL1 archaeon SCGC-AAA259M10]|uniref:Ubiquitin Mut7-C domain-containing protein n=2 Tax=candidate division MSBL1 TaxID=215777 RepID=A0A133U6Y2_9EURY|nr:hypothetical protein AKJ61_01765 [candidate division MSBL1 archaeon SCGC-AAA259B11]KXA99002.1 hypothetical protein AKJ40_04195 [candidate division MSBL1 archaeon SCGC-AAA259M10]
MEVRLYGKLREKAPKTDKHSGKIGIIEIDSESFENISEILEYLEIREEEISHIFLDGEYTNPDRKISKENRLAIFPRDMGLLYKWYFSTEE